MFITLTIDTHVKKSVPQVKMHKRVLNPAQGWRKPLNLKKRTLIQKIKDWRKEIRGKQYKLDGQAVMF